MKMNINLRSIHIDVLNASQANYMIFKHIKDIIIHILKDKPHKCYRCTCFKVDGMVIDCTMLNKRNTVCL